LDISDLSDYFIIVALVLLAVSLFLLSLRGQSRKMLHVGSFALTVLLLSNAVVCFLLRKFQVFAPLLLLFALAVFAYDLRGSQRKALRTSACISAVLLLGGGAIYAFGVWFTPVERGVKLWAPDGKHVALIRYELLGSLGDDRTLLHIRRAWSPISRELYLGQRISSNQDRTYWIDSEHLALNAVSGDPRICNQKLGAIQIVCIP